MALGSYVQNLKNKHEGVDKDLKEELKHPKPDTLRVAKLKKLKLQLKDEIHSLSTDA